MSKFKPKDKSFYDLFAAAADNIAAGAAVLCGLTGKKADSRKAAEKLAGLEMNGDQITLELLRILGASFVTPFDRSDIHSLTSAMEKVIDHMETAGALVHMLDLGPLPVEAKKLIDILAQSANQTTATMATLKKLKGLDSFWNEIKGNEKTANSLQRQFLVRITSDEFDSAEVTKLRAVMVELQSAMRAFEDVADIVRAILIKES